MIPPLTLAVAAGGWLALEGRENDALQAAVSGPPSADTDGDGLTDAQELVLMSRIDQADSDGDGLSDAEELARGRSLLFASPAAIEPRLRLGMSTYGAADGLHATVAVYVRGVPPTSVALRLGLVANGRIIQLPNEWVASHSQVWVAPAQSGHACVMMIDLRLHEALVLQAGSISLFATGALPGSGVTCTADATHLFNVGGVVVLAMKDPTIAPLPGAESQGGGTPPPTGASTLYVPLTTGSGSGSDLSNWTAGEICQQYSSPISVSGAMVTEEVVSSMCVEGWDAYCPPSCSTSVGSTFTTIDPVVLIGG